MSLPLQTYTTLLVCTPFWYLLRVLVMRRSAKQGPPQLLSEDSADARGYADLGESKMSIKTQGSSDNSSGIAANQG
jgi:hypothetical protein